MRGIRENGRLIASFALVIVVSVVRADALGRSLLVGGLLPAIIWIMLIVYFAMTSGPPGDPPES